MRINRCARTGLPCHGDCETAFPSAGNAVSWFLRRSVPARGWGARKKPGAWKFVALQMSHANFGTSTPEPSSPCAIIRQWLVFLKALQRCWSALRSINVNLNKPALLAGGCYDGKYHEIEGGRKSL